MRIRNPESFWPWFRDGSKINIKDPQHCLGYRTGRTHLVLQENKKTDQREKCSPWAWVPTCLHAQMGTGRLQDWECKLSRFLPWAWAPPPREPGPAGPGGPWRYGRNGGGQWGLYLERLRPVNLIQSIQEGRDGTGETAWVSEAFTLSLRASVPWTWSSRSRRAVTVREKRRGSVRPLPWAWAPPSREPGPVGPGGPWRYGRNDAGQWGPPHQAGGPVQQHRSTWK